MHSASTRSSRTELQQLQSSGSDCRTEPKVKINKQFVIPPLIPRVKYSRPSDTRSKDAAVAFEGSGLCCYETEGEKALVDETLG